MIASQALPEPQVIPLDQLSLRIERAVSRLQPSDKRPRLLRRLTSGPDYPLDPRAAELSRDDAIVFTLQVMMSLEPNEPCTADRTQAATCQPDTCDPCRDHKAEHAALAELVAHELDELEAQLAADAAGESYEETCHPAEGAWWAHCAQCGTRFQASKAQTRFCGATCRKAAQRARDRAAGIVRP